MSIFDHSSDRLKQVIEKVRSDIDLNQNVFPGLADLLDRVVDPNVDVSREESVRGLLQVFWQSRTDATYSDTLAKYLPDEVNRIRDFVEHEKSAEDVSRDFHMGLSLGAREELPVIDLDGDGIPDVVDDSEIPEVHALSIGGATTMTEDITIYEEPKQKNKVLIYTNKKFQNWGRTVQNTPRLTCVARTSYGIQQIVKYANQHNMNVRAAGYRHSWSPLFGKDNQITISTLGLTRASMLPNIESLPGSQFFLPQTELNSIDYFQKPEPNKKRLVRVGTAVTNQQFRRWCNAQDVNHASTLPLNVIMVEITLGGSNAPICHGAGRKHPTLSDLVYAIEYVDANGDMQSLSKDKDPEMMTVAAGCFGLLGIVTHLTLELDPMSYAVMIPQKLPVMQAIPPPPGLKDEDIPPPLFTKMTAEERAKAQSDFEAHARDDFYAEWFWFPYTSKVWVNCWNTSKDARGAKEYPSDTGVWLQFAETVLIQIIQSAQAMLSLQDTFPWAQTTLISKMGLYALPEVTDPKKAIKTQLPNGLHFRRAIQNVRVRDMEMEIPLQPKRGLLQDAKFEDEINWALVQKAWWDAILAAYRHKEHCPQRMPLEMRITGPSKIVMAPYRGHKLGTCSIEVLTLENMKGPLWNAFAQDVLDQWMELKDNDGNYLNTRPHWAKEWFKMSVRGKPMIEYLKTSYHEAIVEFRNIYEQIAAKQGWTVSEAKERFSNDLLDRFFFEEQVNGTATNGFH
ncbi:hypothetical protein H2198_007631 [Neophaeococcomyces mojaviensis]|uniref:Uncharacterized protein n=1 Tax=Neophaeococcomyces mojaviensis TaxID=3383035 RepID=A0ACC2ZZS2_9EURO|nr:hypothetical protein H2198_007631 [Knufia sp. JES_112]